MIITDENNYSGFDNWLEGKKKIFLVCDHVLKYLVGINKKLETVNIPIIRFSDFKPNPLYESVVEGVELYRKENCDSIIAIGGGSAIDVAKCIKLYAFQKDSGKNGEWLKETNDGNDIPFLAVPTTAGTGSEATRYAVVYFKGEKQSITSDTIIPDVVLMDCGVLNTLPVYQKKATMCDALSHAIESFWSVNSTDKSKEYSRAAISSILEHMDGYLSNSAESNMRMLMAAHIAGKAINITQTTAGHAMSYKLTSLFGIAHGHAAIICNSVIYKWMVNNPDKCVDCRGIAYVTGILDEIGKCLGSKNRFSGADEPAKIINKLGLDVPAATENDFYELKNSVNPVRLKNHPYRLDIDTIDSIYHSILKKVEE